MKIPVLMYIDFCQDRRAAISKIGARIAYNEIDLVLFFRDPLNAEGYEPDVFSLLRLCDMHNIPIATNCATAEVLIHGLERGDLDWRDIVNPKKLKKADIEKKVIFCKSPFFIKKYTV